MPTRRIVERLRGVHPELPLFLAAVTLMSVCDGLVENVYNNYLWEHFHVTPQSRGTIEFIREFPGLTVAGLTALAAVLSETRLAALSAVVTALGAAGLALCGASWWPMLGATLLVSAGTHVIMPVRDSLTMGLGTAAQRGRRLGQVGAVRTVGSIAGAGIVWFVFEGLSGARAGAARGAAPAVAEHAWEFEATFWMASAVCLAAALCFVLLRNVGDHVRRSAMIVRRRYGLYYMLHVLNGARKQVFLTFGRWVLVTVFAQPASLFAKLSIAASVVGVGFTPLVGRAIDRFGERRVLTAEAWSLLLVCLGYASAQHLGLQPAWALAMVCTCFVGDQLFFALGMARETYVSKIAVNRQELVATLSMGVTINHLISMTVPSAGGFVWERWGYEWVFLAGAGLAILMWIAAARVPRHPSTQ